jgi:hypothetical protein
MVRRSLLAALALLALGGFALAQTYRGLIVGLTDKKLTILFKQKGETKPVKKVLEVADDLAIVQPKGKEEKRIPLPELRRRVAAAMKGPGTKGLFAGVQAAVDTNDKGQVDTIRLPPIRLPQEVAALLARAGQFEKAGQVELYSLEPEPDPRAAKDPKATFFRGWLILGKMVLKDTKTRQQALVALDEALGWGPRAKCFCPRHAIQVTHGGKTVDIVICFECGHAYFYFDAKQEEPVKAAIHKGWQPALDTMLKAAGIPLAGAKKE